MFLVLLDPPQRPADALDQAVDAFQRGERREQSFQILVERFFKPVQGFFAKKVASPEDRIDLTQETFFRAYRSLDGFRGESKLSTWLFRIAHYTYLHHLRTGRLRDDAVRISPVDDVGPEGDEWVAHSTAPGADAGLVQNERLRLLSEAIAELPPQMRRSVMLRVYEDHSYRDIAEEMDISIQTVKAHLFQAKARLRKRLQSYFDDVDL